jgi:hypothetical protein
MLLVKRGARRGDDGLGRTWFAAPVRAKRVAQRAQSRARVARCIEIRDGSPFELGKLAREVAPGG